MQQIPSPSVSVGISWGLVALLALGLVFLAFVAVVTVLLSARRPVIPMQPIKNVAVTLLWIVPAVMVVGMIGFVGLYFTAVPVAHTSVHESWSDGRAVVPANRMPAKRITRSATRKVAARPETPASEPRPEKTVLVSQAEQTSPEQSTSAADTAEVPTAATVAGGAVTDSLVANSAGAIELSNKPTSDGLLKVLETSTCEPDWVGKDPVPNDKGVLVSLSSQRFATLHEAEQQLTSQVVSYIKEFYRDEYPLSGDWTVPVSLIERHAIRHLVGETKDTDFGNGIHGTMYRAHLQLELNSALRQGLHDSWKSQLVTHRLTVLGSMLGLVTLMLATSAGYFRLDEFTGGLYRRRLKFAAASLIAAGSLIAWVIG